MSSTPLRPRHDCLRYGQVEKPLFKDGIFAVPRLRSAKTFRSDLKPAWFSEITKDIPNDERAGCMMGAGLSWLRIVYDLIRFLGLGLRSRTSLAAENLFLRKQLAFYQERRASSAGPTIRPA